MYLKFLHPPTSNQQKLIFYQPVKLSVQKRRKFKVWFFFGAKPQINSGYEIKLNSTVGSCVTSGAERLNASVQICRKFKFSFYFGVKPQEVLKKAQPLTWFYVTSGAWYFTCFDWLKASDKILSSSD